MNVVSYKTRPAAKDFIQVEIVVEKNSQKIILIGKVSIGGGGVFGSVVALLGPFKCHYCLHQTTFLLV